MNKLVHFTIKKAIVNNTIIKLVETVVNDSFSAYSCTILTENDNCHNQPLGNTLNIASEYFDTMLRYYKRRG